MASDPIDRDKLRIFMRNQDGQALLIFLDRAIDLLPRTKLPKLFEGYARSQQFWPDTKSSGGLVDAVKRFHAASRRGEYYEDFPVNWRNCMTLSRGTQSWIAECHRLTDLCLAADKGQRYAEAREALELIFALMLQIDECRDDIIFFADEAGSWQVGLEWRTALSAWLRCLAATASAEEYATAVQGAIRKFEPYDTGPLLQTARRTATQAQRAALDTRPTSKRQAGGHPARWTSDST